MEEPWLSPLSCQAAPTLPPAKKKGHENALESTLRDLVDTELLEKQFVYASTHRW